MRMSMTDGASPVCGAIQPESNELAADASTLVAKHGGARVKRQDWLIDCVDQVRLNRMWPRCPLLFRDEGRHRARGAGGPPDRLLPDRPNAASFDANAAFAADCSAEYAPRRHS